MSSEPQLRLVPRNLQACYAASKHQRSNQYLHEATSEPLAATGMATASVMPSLR